MRLILTLIIIFGFGGYGANIAYNKIYLPEEKALNELENSLNTSLEGLAKARKQQEEFQREKDKSKQIQKVITFFDLRREIDYQRTADKKTITILTNILETMHKSKVQLAEISLVSDETKAVPVASASPGGTAETAPPPIPSPSGPPPTEERSLKKKAIAKAVGTYRNISTLVDLFSKMPPLIKVENYELKAINQKGLDSLLELKITITIAFLIKD